MSVNASYPNYNVNFGLIEPQAQQKSQQNSSKQAKSIKVKEFNRYHDFYKKKIDDTIKNNNANIYENATRFYESFNDPRNFMKEVPTCLVETSSESTSNNETQFTALCEDLRTKGIFHVKLEETKSSTFIQYLQQSLED